MKYSYTTRQLTAKQKATTKTPTTIRHVPSIQKALCPLFPSPCETCCLLAARLVLSRRAAGGPLQMFRAKSKSRISIPDVSSDQSVHFDWEQRDFTQTIQLGMTQLTAFLNEFGMRRPIAPPRRPHC